MSREAYGRCKPEQDSVADEARTIDMVNLFKQVGIFGCRGDSAAGAQLVPR